MLEENTTINAHITRNLYRTCILHTLPINILLNHSWDRSEYDSWPPIEAKYIEDV